MLDKDINTGFSKLITTKMADNFVITSPAERVDGKPSMVTPASHVAARYGHATQLVRVKFGFQGWVTASGPQTAPLEAMVNGLLGTLSYDGETAQIKSHHRCFAFDTGYDQACIDAIVQDAIATELDKSECGFGKYDTCEDKATEIAYAAIVDIKQCGILGYVLVDGKPRCYDPAAHVEVLAMATEVAGRIAGSQVASLMTAHSSSMHAYSSSKEAVKSSLRVEWLDHKSERDTATAADLVTLVKELLAAQQAAASKFEAFGIDNIQNKPKKGDSGCNGKPIGPNCQRGWDHRALQQTNKYTTARDNTRGKLDLKLAKLTDCNATRFNTSSFELTEIDYCGKEWDASEAARGEAYVAQHTLATYLNAYVAAVGKDAMKSGITEEKRAEFNKLNEDFAKVVARSQAQTAELQIELDRHSP